MQLKGQEGRGGGGGGTDQDATVWVTFFLIFPCGILHSVLCYNDLKGITQKKWRQINTRVATLLLILGSGLGV